MFFPGYASGPRAVAICYVQFWFRLELQATQRGVRLRIARRFE